MCRPGGSLQGGCSFGTIPGCRRASISAEQLGKPREPNQEPRGSPDGSWRRGNRSHPDDREE
jgi:hypothetical protein